MQYGQALACNSQLIGQESLARAQLAHACMWKSSRGPAQTVELLQVVGDSYMPLTVCVCVRVIPDTDRATVFMAASKSPNRMCPIMASMATNITV